MEKACKHELCGLRNRHEIASHFRMSDGDRASRGDLFLENGNDASIAAEHIAEANRNKSRFAVSLEVHE